MSSQGYRAASSGATVEKTDGGVPEALSRAAVVGLGPNNHRSCSFCGTTAVYYARWPGLSSSFTCDDEECVEAAREKARDAARQRAENTEE